MNAPRPLQDTPGDHELKAAGWIKTAGEYNSSIHALCGIGEALLAVAHELRAIKAQMR